MKRKNIEGETRESWRTLGRTSRRNQRTREEESLDQRTGDDESLAIGIENT